MSVKAIEDWLKISLFDEVPVNICVIDRDFRIVEANSGFLKTYGHWHKKPCYEVCKGRKDHCKSCAAVETFADGKLFRMTEI